VIGRRRLGFAASPNNFKAGEGLEKARVDLKGLPCTLPEMDDKKPVSPSLPTNNHKLRWEPVLAFIATGGIAYALPDWLSIGPRWLLLTTVLLLLVPTIVTHKTGHHSINHLFGIISNAVITAFLCCSLGLLVTSLPTRKEAPSTLLISASLLWCANILTFALWYWRLDGGGPAVRHKRIPYASKGFLFPQLQIESEERKAMGAEDWSPGFIDYLFIAFNTSTAFSPTDTLVLTRWAKLLTMAQALISLLVLVLLVARGINVL